MNTTIYHVSNERRKKLFDLLQYEAFPQNESLPEPDLQGLQNATLTTPHVMVEDCLCYLEWCKHERKDGFTDVIYDLMNYYRNMHSFQPRLTNWRNRERNTIAQHVWNIVAEARDSGELDGMDAILDYLLPEEAETVLSACEFDDRIEILPGSSEGVYLHWSLLGRFRQEQPQGTDARLSVATIKTLQTDLATYKTMGTAAGILEYFAINYVSNHLRLYTSDDELKKQ